MECQHYPTVYIRFIKNNLSTFGTAHQKFTREFKWKFYRVFLAVFQNEFVKQLLVHKKGQIEPNICWCYLKLLRQKILLILYMGSIALFAPSLKVYHVRSKKCAELKILNQTFKYSFKTVQKKYTIFSLRQFFNGLIFHGLSLNLKEIQIWCLQKLFKSPCLNLDIFSCRRNILT